MNETSEQRTFETLFLRWAKLYHFESVRRVIQIKDYIFVNKNPSTPASHNHACRCLSLRWLADHFYWYFIVVLGYQVSENVSCIKTR